MTKAIINKTNKWVDHQTFKGKIQTGIQIHIVRHFVKIWMIWEIRVLTKEAIGIRVSMKVMVTTKIPRDEDDVLLVAHKDLISKVVSVPKMIEESLMIVMKVVEVVPCMILKMKNTIQDTEVMIKEVMMEAC